MRRRVAAGAVLALALAGWLVAAPSDARGTLAALLASPYFPAALVGLYLLRPLLAWPITALSALVGYRYGLALGVPLALAGAVATSLLPYAGARWLDGGDPDAPRGEGWFDRAAGACERFFGATGDLRGVVLARLAPTPAEAVSGAAGLARVPVGAFVLGTALGELPWTVAAVAAGASMRRLRFDVVDWRLALAAGLVAALLAAGPAYRHLRGRDGPASPGDDPA